MNNADHPSFATLRRRFRASDDPADGDGLLALAACDGDAPQPGHDPRLVLRYLHDLGIPAATLDQLHDGINGLADEEELAAHWCREGVAVTTASDGLWFLFLEDRA